jgi:transcriptional regulator with XRE-family HTH domain
MPAEIDVQKLATLVRAKRRPLGLRAAADQIGGISASTLSRVEQGKVPDLDTFLKICEWLGSNPEQLLQDPEGSSEGKQRGPDTAEIIAAHLRADRTLDPQTAQALETMIRLAYKAAREGQLPKKHGRAGG